MLILGGSKRGFASSPQSLQVLGNLGMWRTGFVAAPLDKEFLAPPLGPPPPLEFLPRVGVAQPTSRIANVLP